MNTELIVSQLIRAMMLAWIKDAPAHW